MHSKNADGMADSVDLDQTASFSLEYLESVVLHFLDNCKRTGLRIVLHYLSFIKWAASSEFHTYRICEQGRFRRACASAQSRQNLRCSLIQAVSQEEPSDRKPEVLLCCLKNKLLLALIAQGIKHPFRMLLNWNSLSSHGAQINDV